MECNDAIFFPSRDEMGVDFHQFLSERIPKIHIRYSTIEHISSIFWKSWLGRSVEVNRSGSQSGVGGNKMVLW